MGIIDDLAGCDVKALFDELDEIFSEAGERRAFIAECRKLDNDDLALLQSVLSQSISRDDMLEEIESVTDPLSVADTLLFLHTELAETSSTLLLEFLFALVAKPGVYDDLDKEGETYWETIVFDNPILTGEQISFIWKKKGKSYLKDSDPFIVELIALHPECPLDVLEDLLDYDTRTVQSAIGRNKNISPEIIRKYLNSPRKPDRKALAGNQHVPAEILMSLMGDRYEDIVKSARRNYAKRFKGQPLSKEAIASAIEKNVDKPHVEPKPEKKAVFDPYQAEQLGLEHVVSLPQATQRKKVAEWTQDAGIVAALAGDKSVAVRRAVAAKGQCPEEKLRDLVRDKDLQTSNNAFRSLANRHPGSAAEDLFDDDTLTETYEYINYHVNEKSDEFAYDLKLNARAEAELERAKLVAGTTNNEMLQSRILQTLDATSTMFSIRGSLMSALVGNRHLCDSAVRKLVLELNHGTMLVIRNCSKPDLLDELIADDRLSHSLRDLAINTRHGLLGKQ